MSSRPPLVIQISDLHLGAEWAVGDPVPSVRAAIAAVKRFPAPVEAVIVSGDLSETGADADYELARELLAELGAPVYVLPGNHDDRAAMRRAFELPGEGGEPIQYAAELGPVRLLALDTTRPGSDAGELDEARLAWLEAELARAPERPALIALHHPPLALGIAVWDEIGLAAAGRAGLERVVAGHPQVLGFVSGHVHRSLVGQLGGRPAIAIPSTYEQAVLGFDLTEIEMGGDPPAFAVHSLVDGRLVSHLQPY
jgi:3',5'-cyclic AMP phosphodiesterase CpdA